MRNTRLILGAITLVIGLAGAVSNAAASRVGTLAKIFVTTVGGHGKTCRIFTAPCAHGSGVTCKTGLLNNGRTVWTIVGNCGDNPYKRAN